MNVQRGEVVLVDFPYSGGTGTKVRPALVVQNDVDNVRLTNTILVQITGTTQRELQPTQVLVEVTSLMGRSSGLRFDSVVNCANILTVDKARILRKVGELQSETMQEVNRAIKAVLDLA